MTSFSEPYKMICDVFFKSSHSERFGKTKLGLAQCLGVSQGKAQGWEKGTWPKAEDLRTIHEKLGFNLYWLVTGEGKPFESAPEAAASVTPIESPAIAELQPVPTEFAALQAEVSALRAEVAALTKDLITTQKDLIAANDRIIELQRNQRQGNSLIPIAE